MNQTIARNMRMGSVPAGDPERAELEGFVGAAFLSKHAATVTSFLPTLLSFRNPSGQLRGVIGLRGAGEERLYLEQYLDLPVETAIAAASGRRVERSQVVEVGNLASANCRTAMRMVAVLPAHLLAREFRWIVFTATSAVRGILQGFGAPLVELARADLARVAGSEDRWGRYYESDPRVFAGYLPDSRLVAGFCASAHDH